MFDSCRTSRCPSNGPNGVRVATRTSARFHGGAGTLRLHRGAYRASHLLLPSHCGHVLEVPHVSASRWVPQSAGNRPSEAVPRLPSWATDCFWARRVANLRSTPRCWGRQDDRCHRRGTGTSTSALSSTGNGSFGQPLFGGNQEAALASPLAWLVGAVHGQQLQRVVGHDHQARSSVSTMRALFSGARVPARELAAGATLADLGILIHTNSHVGTPASGRKDR
jgi:hypothetical protein